jgi:hypothetical protein
MIKNRVRKTAVTLGMDRSHSVPKRIHHMELARKSGSSLIWPSSRRAEPPTVAHEVELGCKRVK